MIQNPLIARADLDAIIWVIVVVATIVAQIVKSVRKTPPHGAAPPARRTPGTPFEDDLREFLEKLSGGAEVTPEPVFRPTPTPPPPPPPRPPPRLAVRAPAAPRPAPTPVSAPVAQPRREPSKTEAPGGPSRRPACPVWRQALRGNPRSVRHAVVLRELLGPPLALRPRPESQSW